MKTANATSRAERPKAVAVSVLLGLVAALILLPAARGQAAQAKESFPQFWARFKAAVARDDRQAVASITRFRTGDATYLSDEEFLATRYRELQRERRCLARARPVRDGEAYSVFCGEFILLFERVEGAWKFVEFGVND